MIHTLKIQKMYLNRILSKEKKFEIRFNDRDYQVGDLIRLEPIGIDGAYYYKITYIHSGFGMADGYVVLGIEVEK